MIAKKTAEGDLVWPIIRLLCLDVRLLFNPVEIFVQTIQQKRHQLLRVLLLVTWELRLEPADWYLQRTQPLNKSVFSLRHWLSTWCCPRLLLSTGACCTVPTTCPQVSIDISCPQGTQQQTRQPQLLLSTDETDRWTLNHYILRRHHQ